MISTAPVGSLHQLPSRFYEFDHGTSRLKSHFNAQFMYARDQRAQIFLLSRLLVVTQIHNNIVETIFVTEVHPSLKI